MRKAVDIRCSVSPRDGRTRRQRIVDLSPLGAWLGTSKPLAVGELVKLSFNANGGALELRAEVMWTGNKGMALEFVGLDDITRRAIDDMIAAAPFARGTDAAFVFADVSPAVTA